ncbi:MAG: hypothetical protein KGJ02_00650 [Verrucomicrobiota bacterium]|nr:hypothetical protein [Verrucomicrobiota bacterium]
MNKIGTGNHGPKTPDPRKDLEVSTRKFEEAFQQYLKASPTDKPRLKGVMDTHLHLIQESSRELQRLHKQEFKLEADYRHFFNEHSEESILAIEHDLQTLRDYLSIVNKSQH